MVQTEVARGRRAGQNRPMAADTPDISAEIDVVRWDAIADRQRLVPALDAIFFESSGTQSFADEAERQAFRERWLGKYLADEPEWAYSAITRDGTLAGYLVGSLSEASGLEGFAAAATDYPAHLHVNLAAAYRNRGIGGKLVAAFAADAGRAGAKGVHVVTSADARNVRFYERSGFREVARSQLGGRDLLFLGRRLKTAETA